LFCVAGTCVRDSLARLDISAGRLSARYFMCAFYVVRALCRQGSTTWLYRKGFYGRAPRGLRTGSSWLHRICYALSTAVAIEEVDLVRKQVRTVEGFGPMVTKCTVDLDSNVSYLFSPTK